MTAIEELIKFTEELKAGYNFSFDMFYDKAHELLKKEQQDKIDFAKLHVTEALKQASKKAKLKLGDYSMDDYYIDEKSILNCYPLENIK